MQTMLHKRKITYKTKYSFDKYLNLAVKRVSPVGSRLYPVAVQLWPQYAIVGAFSGAPDSTQV